MNLVLSALAAPQRSVAPHSLPVRAAQDNCRECSLKTSVWLKTQLTLLSK